MLVFGKYIVIKQPNANNTKISSTIAGRCPLTYYHEAIVYNITRSNGVNLSAIEGCIQMLLFFGPPRTNHPQLCIETGELVLIAQIAFMRLSRQRSISPSWCWVATLLAMETR